MADSNSPSEMRVIAPYPEERTITGEIIDLPPKGPRDTVTRKSRIIKSGLIDCHVHSFLRQVYVNRQTEFNKRWDIIIFLLLNEN